MTNNCCPECACPPDCDQPGPHCRFIKDGKPSHHCHTVKPQSDEWAALAMAFYEKARQQTTKAGWCNACAYFYKELPRFTREVAASAQARERQRIEDLVQELCIYTFHEPGCWSTFQTSSRKCDCGLDAVRDDLLSKLREDV